jgi:hypothetical protein
MRQLSADFATAARLYAEAVVQITRTPIAPSGSVYEQLRKAVEDTRKQADVAALAFYRHIDSHQLGVSRSETGCAFGSSVIARQPQTIAEMLTGASNESDLGPLPGVKNNRKLLFLSSIERTMQYL